MFNLQILGKSTKKTTIAEAQEASIKTFTKKVIKDAFHNTGMWPWNPEKLLNLAKEQLGKLALDDKNPDLQRICVDMARAVIRDVKDQEDKRSKNREIGKAEVEKGRLYDVNDHLELHRIKWEKEEEEIVRKEEKQAMRKRKKILREEEKVEREKKRRAMTCRNCGKRWAQRLKEDWDGCEHCEFYWLCAECTLDHADELEEHERTHVNNDNDDEHSDEDDDNDEDDESDDDENK